MHLINKSLICSLSIESIHKNDIIRQCELYNINEENKSCCLYGLQLNLLPVDQNVEYLNYEHIQCNSNLMINTNLDKDVEMRGMVGRTEYVFVNL